MKKFLLLYFLLISFGSLKAQQTVNFSQYYINPFLINPSAAGAHSYAECMATYRKQWVQVDGAPTTQALTLETPLTSQTMGVGLYLYNDVSNILGQTGVLAAYRYTALLSQHHHLSLGLAVGVADKRIYFDKIRAKDPFEQVLLLNQENRTALDGNFGITYRFRKANIGFSAQQIFGNQLNFANTTDERLLSFNLIRHYYLTVSYEFTLSEKLTLNPYLLVKSAQGLPSQFDVNAILKYQRNHWLGVSYRHQSSAALSIGTFFDNRFTVSYAYELPVNALAGYSGSSHECTLGFRFGGSNNSKNNNKISPLHKTDFEQLSSDNQKQYELLDQLQQDNELLREKVDENNIQIRDQHEEIARLMQMVQDQQKEVKQAIQAVQIDSMASDTAATTGLYYAVIGAFKTLQQAKQYQKIIKRELQFPSSVVQSQRISGINFFFIYTQSYHKLSDALQETKRIHALETKGLIVGNPWVYRMPIENQ